MSKYMTCRPRNNFFQTYQPLQEQALSSSALRTIQLAMQQPRGSNWNSLNVEFAKENGSIIVYDSAYAAYISDGSPRSICEIPGAKEVAIKIDGFTGVRLGWTVVPEDLLYSNRFPVIHDFNRIVCTCFNGASSIAQAKHVFPQEGLTAILSVVDYYKENTNILVDTFASLGLKVYGGVNAPYVWVHFPGLISWDDFAKILEKAHIITVPGSGFGPRGEEYTRVAAFGHRESILESLNKAQKAFLTDQS